MILLDDVHLKLASAAGDVNILRGVGLEIEAGESVGVVGPSGAGKSSMMMIIGGLERATSGKVEVAGADLTALNEDQLALWRRGAVGIVFQSFRLVPTMTALENVAMPLELAGTMTALENVAMPLELAGRADAFARAEHQLGAVGLGHRLGHYPEQLSGGEQQRTALARAFVAEPKLLLADEPTGNLDGTTGQAIIELMFELRARAGTTMVLITHDRALAGRCDRVVHLADGLIVGDERRLRSAAAS